jgi:predicted nuclease of predicted toxin-antitoxin system
MTKMLISVLMARFAHVMPATSCEPVVLQNFPCTDTAVDLVIIIRASQSALLVISLVPLL